MQIPGEVTPFGNNVVPLGTNISGTAGLRWKQTKIRGALFFEVTDKNNYHFPLV
jgi:hypothetical protein